MSEKSDEQKRKIVTPRFRVSFPSVYEKGRNGKYSVIALFPADADLLAMRKLATAVMKEKWGEKPHNFRSPFRDQGEKKYDGYEPGNVFITMRSKTRPGIVGPDGRTIIGPEHDNEEEFYAGCWARATCVAFAYGGEGTDYTPGVSFALHNLQKVADGEPFSSKHKPEDDFPPIEGAAEQDDETARSLEDLL